MPPWALNLNVFASWARTLGLRTKRYCDPRMEIYDQPGILVTHLEQNSFFAGVSCYCGKSSLHEVLGLKWQSHGLMLNIQVFQ